MNQKNFDQQIFNMKTLICFLALFIGLSQAQGQHFEVNEIDKFTKAQRLTTSNARLKTGMLAFIRTYTDTANRIFYFITLHGSIPESKVIGEDEKVIFLLDNDEKITGYSTGFQSYTVGTGTYGKMYRHQYRITEADLKKLSETKVVSIRKYATDSFADVEIPERNQSEIKKLALLVLKELKK